MKKFNYTLAILSIVAVTLFGASQAMADPSGDCQRGQHPERTVELIENGFIVTLTAEDPEDVARIQERAERRAEFEAMSPEEQEAVREERRQRAAEGEGRRGRGHGRGHGPRDFPREGVERVIVNTDSGVQIITTSDDPEVAEQLIEIGQQMLERGERRGQGGRR